MELKGTNVTRKGLESVQKSFSPIFSFFLYLRGFYFCIFCYTGSHSQSDAFWFLMLIEFFRLWVDPTSPLSLMPKTQERRILDESSWVRCTLPSPVA